MPFTTSSQETDRVYSYNPGACTGPIHYWETVVSCSAGQTSDRWDWYIASQPLLVMWYRLKSKQQILLVHHTFHTNVFHSWNRQVRLSVGPSVRRSVSTYWCQVWVILSSSLFSQSQTTSWTAPTGWNLLRWNPLQASGDQLPTSASRCCQSLMMTIKNKLCQL